MNEVRQLNGKISDEKKLLNRLYLEMGQKLYDTYKDVELPLEEFDGDFRKIRERYVAIDLLQEKIRNVKGVVLCRAAIWKWQPEIVIAQTVAIRCRRR